tara:strand:+ start:278 stop:493 length:216 start_codon:yes stop_codon:yes gene_type:complete
MVREEHAGEARAAERVVVAADEKGVGVVGVVVGEEGEAHGTVEVLVLPGRVGGGLWDWRRRVVCGRVVHYD